VAPRIERAERSCATIPSRDLRENDRSRNTQPTDETIHRVGFSSSGPMQTVRLDGSDLIRLGGIVGLNYG
jgi:hypothetical protein